MKISHAFFDLDGTLTDSSPGIVNSIKYALEQMGITENDEQKLISFVGPSLQNTFKNNYFSKEVDHQQAIKHYRTYFASKGIFENSLYSGALELLETVKAQNVKIALATAKPTYFANIILNHFDIAAYFDVVVGSHLNGSRTDKKEIIYEAKDQLGLPKSEHCVMIGDREYDINGGKHHSMNTIGVSYGYAKENELQRADPDFIVHEPLDIASAMQIQLV